MVGFLDTPADGLRIEVFGAKRGGGDRPHAANRSVVANDRQLTASEARRRIIAKRAQQRSIKVRQYEIVGTGECHIVPARCRQARIERRCHTPVDLAANDCDPRARGLKGDKHGLAAIGRAVIDNDYLKLAGFTVQNARHRTWKKILLVVVGNYDGKQLFGGR